MSPWGEPKVINEVATIPAKPEASIKARLFALMDLLLEDSKFDKMTQTIIRNLAKNFIGGNVTDDELRAQIVNVRDEIIPLVLGEKPKSQGGQ